MKNLSWRDVPRSFVLCDQSSCPKASCCLRQMAMQVAGRRDRFLTIVNPQRTALSAKCAYYRDATPVAYGRGFLHMQSQMLPAQYREFSYSLRRQFGRNAYYERRSGRHLCSPSEVACVRRRLASLGLSHLDFDAYEERYNWDD